MINKELLGRVLQSVEVSLDKTLLFIELQDGTMHIYKAYGDCCSESWIEHFDTIDKVNGAMIVALDQQEDWKPIREEQIPPKENSYDDTLKFYETRIRTNRGDITIEYRNLSNGYYGGSLDMVKTKDLKGKPNPYYEKALALRPTKVAPPLQVKNSSDV